MSPWPDIERAIGSATGAPFSLSSHEPAGGGDINECRVIEGGGRRYFVKLNAPEHSEMFAAEAESLREIADSGTVRVPAPVCHGTGASRSWLVLEYLELRRADTAAMRSLGARLARLHAVTRPRPGWHRDNTIGTTPQINSPRDDWVLFWRENRLGYQLRLAAGNGHHALAAAGERLMEKLPAYFAGHVPVPALLHGDLWSGNAAMTADGEPVLYDPAVYYGDREADIAMTELFGGFAPAFYDAYLADYPLDAGYAARKPLYNLYHVLNHANLFGGGYIAQAARMIGKLLARV